MKVVEIYLGKDLVTTVFGVKSLAIQVGTLELRDSKGEVKAFFDDGYSFVVVHEDEVLKPVAVYEADVSEK